jgi:hypothetical protein
LVKRIVRGAGEMRRLAESGSYLLIEVLFLLTRIG